MTPDGMVLCRARKLATREYEMTWVEQARGFDLRTRAGYLIRGYHVQARSVEQARKLAATARRRSLAATIARRQDKRLKKLELSALKTIYISVDHSIQAGNCAPSTKQFAQQMWDRLGVQGPCAVRADLVIAARDDVYTRRALGAAIARA
mgnify:CR=1 FL=1